MEIIHLLKVYEKTQTKLLPLYGVYQTLIKTNLPNPTKTLNGPKIQYDVFIYLFMLRN